MKRQIRLAFNARKQTYEYRLERQEGANIFPESGWLTGVYDVERTAAMAESTFGRMHPMTIEA